MNSLFRFLSMGFGPFKKLKVLECLRQSFRGEAAGLFLTVLGNSPSLSDILVQFSGRERFHVSLITVSHAGPEAAKHTTTTMCDHVFIKCHVSATPAVTQTFKNKLNSSVHRIFFQTFRCHCGLWANTFPHRARYGLDGLLFPFLPTTLS